MPSWKTKFVLMLRQVSRGSEGEGVSLEQTLSAAQALIGESRYAEALEILPARRWKCGSRDAFRCCRQ